MTPRARPFRRPESRFPRCQPDADAIHVEVFDVGVADRGQDAAKVGIGSEESGLDQRRMGDGVADALALRTVAATFDGDGDELAGPFAVANDRLRQFPGDGDHRLSRSAA
jgi:hypothetical protein